MGESGDVNVQNSSLENFTPAYSLVTVEASDQIDAIDTALQKGTNFRHDRAAVDGAWSLESPVTMEAVADDG